MPRMSRQGLAAETVSKGRGLIASGRRLAPKKSDDPTKRYKAKQAAEWQRLIWEFYDTIGEFRYSVNWVGNTLSRARLYCLDMRTGKPTTNAVAQGAMMKLYGGPEYQKEMLRLLGIHFTAAGDCYLVGVAGEKETDPDQWEIVAASELRRTSNGDWKNGERVLGSANGSLLIRLWRPHPRKSSEADAPSRAVIPILAEIDGLTRHVAAQIDSRLAGAGVLLVPSEIDFSTTQTTRRDEAAVEQQTPDDSDSANNLALELMETMQASINDRESAAALVPIILQAKGEDLKGVKHITFSTPLDAQAPELRKEAIGRLALGMDMPPEILTGTGDLSHWNAWSVEDAAIKSHTEPMLAILTSSLTEGFLRPLLEDEKVSQEDIDSLVVAADTTDMRLRPNRSKEALELYDRGALDEKTLRVENGFEEDAKLDDQELRRWLALQLAKGSPSPEMMIEAFKELGFDMPDAAAAQVRISENETPTGGDQPKGRENITPSIQDHPVTGPPDTQDASLQVVFAVGELLVAKALERAGQRLRSKSREVARHTADLKLCDIYTEVVYDVEDVPALLDNAWDSLSLCDVPHKAALAGWLQKYTSALLEDKRKHDPNTFRRFLELEFLLRSPKMEIDA